MDILTAHLSLGAKLLLVIGILISLLLLLGIPIPTRSNHAVVEEIKTQHNDECRPAKLGLRSGTYPGEVVAYMYTWLRTWYNSTWLIT